MPIYDFFCSECGQAFEELTTRDGPNPACPKCGSPTVEKRMSMPSPLKKGAFPFKPQGVHPLAGKMAMGQAACSSCGGNCGQSD